jgi:hypothetical protein
MNKLQNGGLSRPQKTGKIRKVKMLRMLFSCFCAFDVSSDALRTFFYILLFASLLNLIKQNLNPTVSNEQGENVTLSSHY